MSKKKENPPQMSQNEHLGIGIGKLSSCGLATIGVFINGLNPMGIGLAAVAMKQCVQAPREIMKRSYDENKEKGDLYDGLYGFGTGFVPFSLNAFKD